MAPVLDFARPHVLRTEAEYNAAVARVDELLRLNPVEASDEWEELRFLSVLIEAYEEENERIEPASPQEIVELMLDQHGMARADLAEILGGRSRVSEFFNGKRDLSLGQIRKLASRFHIPADLLIGAVSSEQAED